MLKFWELQCHGSQQTIEGAMSTVAKNSYRSKAAAILTSCFAKRPDPTTAWSAKTNANMAMTAQAKTKESGTTIMLIWRITGDTNAKPNNSIPCQLILWKYAKL